MLYVTILYSGNYTCGVFRDCSEAADWAAGPGRFHPAVLWHRASSPAGAPLQFMAFEALSNPTDPSPLACWSVPAHGPIQREAGAL